ncbi:MAG: FAD-binding oxidoreductase, partial [Pseudomonadota bacterium]
MLTPANFDFVAGLGLTPEHPGPTHLEEPRGLARGRGVLVRPRSTQEVSRLLAGCTAAGVAVVPHGGGTGLVGGQLTDAFHPVILSMARMTATRAVDPVAGTLMIEAGATLAAAQDAARGVGRLFPLSLASEGTATVGGVLATNAGGVQVLRYGNARDLCLGVEAVMADGTVHHGLTGLRKDNTGYDLRHLLIGAEGTLGVITAACLRLFPRPAARWTFFGVVRGPDAALSLLSQLQDATGGLLTAFELISGQGPRFVAQTHPHQRQPFNPVPDWMVLVEAGAGPGQDLERLLEPSLARAFDNGLLSDGLVAQSDTQRAEFWSLRETIPDANRR